MALDEPTDEDEKHEVKGIQWLVGPQDRDFILSGGGVRVDRVEGAFGGFFHVARVRGGGGCC